MATVNGTTLSRTRSARISNTTTTKPVQTSSRGAASSATSSTHSIPHPPASPTTVSHVSLFLTNLRLLDLDLHPDWPDINTHTFTAKDAAQGGGQKKRIQCVEWALYHLFALWDPDEARNKLHPFFPPLDQVQSLNLRAALLRSLEQAKKNGVLGRDAVVRKTMLDECKGERLEEVLAVFSSAVLKKLVAEQQLNEKGYPALAQTLALENRGYSDERTELTALVLAHRVSLRRALHEKNEARRRFREFSELFGVKEKELSRRREEAEAARRSVEGKGATEGQKPDVARILRNNWTGNERWMEALLYGDSKAHTDGVLSAPFDRVWKRVQAGRLAELEDTSSPGLLEQLDSRVRGQQERLERWQDFRKRMFGRDGPELVANKPEVQSKKGIDLGFGAHEKLHLGRGSSKKIPAGKPAALDSHYKGLIDSLQSELARVSPATSRIPSFFHRPQPVQRLPREAANNGESELEPEVISDISDLDEAPVPTRPSPTRRDPIRVLEEPAFVPTLRKAKTFDEEHDHEEEPPTPSRLRRAATMQTHSTSPRRRFAPQSPTRSPEQTRPIPRRKPPPRPLSPPPLDGPVARAVNASPEPLSPEEERPISPTQQLADEILASVSAASPSPVKKPRHRLSLAERTRLSMARRTSHANLRVPDDEDGMLIFVEESPEAELESEAPYSPTKPGHPQPVPSAVEDGQTTHEDLVARTRRSMAGFEAARQKAQFERRRSLRKMSQPTPSTPQGGRGGSYFPAVDEEDAGGEGSTTLLLAEELMSGEGKDDYEAVFMSRPKLKTSPVGTPVRGLWD